MKQPKVIVFDKSLNAKHIGADMITQSTEDYMFISQGEYDGYLLRGVVVGAAADLKEVKAELQKIDIELLKLRKAWSDAGWDGDVEFHIKWREACDECEKNIQLIAARYGCKYTPRITENTVHLEGMDV